MTCLMAPPFSSLHRPLLPSCPCACPLNLDAACITPPSFVCTSVIAGCLCKKTLGTGGGGLVHIVWNELGPDATRHTINNTQFTVNYWLLHVSQIWCAFPCRQAGGGPRQTGQCWFHGRCLPRGCIVCAAGGIAGTPVSQPSSGHSAASACPAKQCCCSCPTAPACSTACRSASVTPWQIWLLVLRLPGSLTRLRTM